MEKWVDVLLLVILGSFRGLDDKIISFLTLLFPAIWGLFF